jgi:hypothetical protein
MNSSKNMNASVSMDASNNTDVNNRRDASDCGNARVRRDVNKNKNSCKMAKNSLTFILGYKKGIIFYKNIKFWQVFAKLSFSKNM